MKAKIATLADYANVTADQKLNILGIFNVINAAQAPVVHRQLQLVLSFSPDPWDSADAIPFEVQLVDEDGKQVLSFKGQINQARAPSGEQPTTNCILGLNDVRFDKFGHYEFKVLANDEALASIPLLVQQLPMPQSPN